MAVERCSKKVPTGSDNGKYKRSKWRKNWYDWQLLKDIDTAKWKSVPLLLRKKSEKQCARGEEDYIEGKVHSIMETEVGKCSGKSADEKTALDGDKETHILCPNCMNKLISDQLAAAETTSA